MLRPPSTKRRSQTKDHIKIQNLPVMGKFKQWRMVFKRTVANASARPAEAMVWITKVEQAKSWEELEDDEGFHSLC